jgi:hypothetical protein
LVIGGQDLFMIKRLHADEQQSPADVARVEVALRVARGEISFGAFEDIFDIVCVDAFAGELGADLLGELRHARLIADRETR